MAVGVAMRYLIPFLAKSKDVLRQPVGAVKRRGNPLALRPDEKMTQADHDFHQARLKILNSTIFHRGGLKGKALSPPRRGYRTWPIAPLEGFINKRARVMLAQDTPTAALVRAHLHRKFDSLLAAYDEVAPLAKLLGVPLARIEALRVELAGWRDKVQARLPLPRDRGLMTWQMS